MITIFVLANWQPAILSSQTAKDFRVNQDRIEKRILALGEFGKNPQGGVSRVAFSQADVDGRKYIVSLMELAGLQVRIDAAGNLIGRREGRNAKLPPILFGSHIDSVPEGGNYDGDVGTLGAIECAQVLHENNITTEHPLEVIVFSDEEGGLVGSRALAGTLSEEALRIVSHSGHTIREGIKIIGGDPDKLEQAKREKGSIKAYIELHIEQGSFLDEEKIDIGVVEGIVGIRWWDVIFEGFANHAGTTPMNRRRDALVSAAEFVLAVNRIGKNTPGRQVATVGRIKAWPGAPNVIPGKVVTSLEIRDLSAAKIDSIFEMVQSAANEIAKKHATPIRFSPIDATAIPAPTDVRMRKIISEAAKDLGLRYKIMPSGAGHDAQEVTNIAPVGMIFVPSKDGISHSPREYTSPEDMANGANVLLQTILKIYRGDLQD
jgi:N-carbamoyl-L-amino-acid hydrolase